MQRSDYQKDIKSSDRAHQYRDRGHEDRDRHDRDRNDDRFRNEKHHDSKPFSHQRDVSDAKPANTQRDLREDLRDVRKKESDALAQAKSNKRTRDNAKDVLEPVAKRIYTDSRSDRERDTFVEKQRNNPQQHIIPQMPVRSNTVRPSTAPASLFRGDFSRNYANLLVDVKENEPSYRNFRSLGTIHENSDKYYFAESNSVIDHANDFMGGFWSDSENRRATIENHQDKYHVKGNQSNNKPLHPCCISFIDVSIGNKSYCFVAVSGTTNLNKNVKTQLQRYADTYNRQQKDCEFVFLQGNVGNFSTLVSGLSNHKDGALYKECSEKFYASCLTKLFYQYGENMRVTGVVNCSFYPFHKNNFYGEYRHSVDPTIVPPITFDGVSELKNGYQLTRKPCCKTCQDNKDNVLSIMKTAQQKGVQHQKEKAIAVNHNDFITSPLRNSIYQSCSLLRENSVFPQVQALGSGVREDKRKVEIKVCNK